MTDHQSLIRLQTWLSPAFPTGSFSYSSGLESAVASGLVIGKEDLRLWLASQLDEGPLWNDAVILAECWRTADIVEAVQELNQLALSLCFSAERHLETTAQGEAFIAAAKAWGPVPITDKDCALPVAVGAVCATHRIDIEASLTAFLHATVSNQVQAALRLIKLGQQQGVEVLAMLEQNILATADRASASSLEDLGSSTFMQDILAMQHNDLESRIFRT